MSWPIVMHALVAQAIGPETWPIVIGALVTVQLGVNGFMCVTQIRQGLQIARLETSLNILLGEREEASGARRVRR